MKVGDMIKRRNKSRLYPGRMWGVIVGFDHQHVDVLWGNGVVSWVHPYKIEVISESR